MVRFHNLIRYDNDVLTKACESLIGRKTNRADFMLLDPETAKKPVIRSTREPESCPQEDLQKVRPTGIISSKIAFPVVNGEPPIFSQTNFAVFGRETS